VERPLDALRRLDCQLSRDERVAAPEGPVVRVPVRT